MKTYFLQQDGNTVGPFCTDQLRQLKISKSTYVWNYNTGWKMAGYVDELKDVIYYEPPTFQPFTVVPTGVKYTLPDTTSSGDQAAEVKYRPSLLPEPTNSRKAGVIIIGRIMSYFFTVVITIATTMYVVGKTGYGRNNEAASTNYQRAEVVGKKKILQEKMLLAKAEVKK